MRSPPRSQAGPRMRPAGQPGNRVAGSHGQRTRLRGVQHQHRATRGPPEPGNPHWTGMVKLLLVAQMQRDQVRQRCQRVCGDARMRPRGQHVDGLVGPRQRAVQKFRRHHPQAITELCQHRCQRRGEVPDLPGHRQMHVAARPWPLPRSHR
jgi:hypothetical protein